MKQNHISILVVDDAKFSSVMINQILKKSGYTNVRHAASARRALSIMQDKKPDILLADWIMPEMDGLELTREIRKHDEVANRYTYTILLTANDGIEQLRQAFDEGVDDFVSKSEMQTHLVARILAAERIVALQNRILRDNHMLLEANTHLRKNGLLDQLTGLGNSHFAMRTLRDTLLHTRARGGATCYLLIRLDNLKQLAEKHNNETINQLIISFAQRIRKMVRPLDHVSRISSSRFVVISHQPGLESFSPSSFKRIHQRLNLKTYKTNAGFISVRASISISGASNESGLPSVEAMMIHAESFLNHASASGTIQSNTWRKKQPEIPRKVVPAPQFA